MKKQITIADVQEIKHGVNAQGPWQLLKVIDQDNADYSTFETKVLEMVGRNVEIHYNEEEVPSKKDPNKMFVNRTLTSIIPFRAEVQGVTRDEFLKLVEKVMKLEGRINDAVNQGKLPLE